MKLTVKKSLAGLFSGLYSCSAPRFDFETGRESAAEIRGFLYALLKVGLLSDSDFEVLSNCCSHLLYSDELTSDDKHFLKDFLYLKF